MGEPIFQVGFDHEAHTQGYQMITEYEALERYDEMLDQCHEGFRVGGIWRDYSHVLKSVDPIMYRCEFNNYTAHLEEDNIYVEGITEPPKDS